ncbi:aldehyde dehydrogenase [Xylariales sp. PMI_506]|nr:aldehyde dehydrogenase [Xylariales sp. PMI_506]
MGSRETNFYTFANVVDGELRSSSNVANGIDPSTKQKLWDVPQAVDADLDDAVAAARKAFPQWSQTSWEDRGALIHAARQILLEHEPDMAALVTKEVGKPIQFGHLEVQHALNFLEFNANSPPLGERVVQDDDELRLTLRYQPVGVVGAISPWNFPLVLAVAKIAAALITGNCVIVKPSPFAPYSVLKFAELVRGVFPPGVLQALNGGEDLGPRIVAHPGIDKITFTGSTATGKKVMAAVAATGQGLKSLTLELGGNSACVVCPDVNVQAVAPQVAVGAFFNSGQFCMGTKRLYVHEDIYDVFLKELVGVVGSWKVGATSDLATDVMLGPVQNDMQYQIVKTFFQDSVDNGLNFALGGPLGKAASESNYIIPPAIIDNPSDNSLVVTHEAFGPILPVMKWRDEEDVITRMNNTESGLGGAVWSKDIGRAERIAGRIEAGTVWINSFEKPLPQAHFSGWKQSGFGGEWGREGLYAYCLPKAIHFYKSSV